MSNQKKNKFIIFLLCIIIFICLTVGVFCGFTNFIDETVSSFVISIRNNYLTDVMTIITNLGGAYSLISLAVLLFIIKRNKKISLLIIINLITVFLESQIFKFIFRRDRPLEIFLVSATGYSYPSGHMMVSSAFYLFLNYLICRNIKSKMLKVGLYIFNILLISLIGFSRIYLGVHYTTDIIAGLILGIIHVILFVVIMKKKGLME